MNPRHDSDITRATPTCDPHPGRRRAVSVVGATLLALCAGHPRLAGAQGPARHEGTAPVLYVYLHTESKFAELERVLKSKLPALNVTVFGRFRDFEEAMAARPPDAVMGIGALLVSQAVRPALQGFRGTLDWETYSLLSVGDERDGSVSGKAIGAVDLLGRLATQDFVAGLLGATDIKVKRVTKMEDLLPLLQLGAADGVVAPTAAVRDMTERSRLPLRVRELGAARVKLPSVGVNNPAARDLIVGQFRALDGATNRMLGVDAWKLP